MDPKIESVWSGTILGFILVCVNIYILMNARPYLSMLHGGGQWNTQWVQKRFTTSSIFHHFLVTFSHIKTINQTVNKHTFSLPHKSALRTAQAEFKRCSQCNKDKQQPKSDLNKFWRHLPVWSWRPYAAFHVVLSQESSMAPLCSTAQLWCQAAAVPAGLKLSASQVGIGGVRVIFGFLVTSLIETLLPRLFSLFRHPAVRGVLVDPNLFHMIIMETAEPLETINGADSFSSLVQICLAPAQSLSSSANSFKLIDLVSMSCKALLRVVCALKMGSCPLNLTQKDLDEDVESKTKQKKQTASKRWVWE